MSLFCLLWAPLLLLFWYSLVSGEESGAAYFWAAVLGTVTALIHYFAGYLVKASGLALSRWFFALTDIIIVPAVLPFLVWGIFTRYHCFDREAESVKFAIFWLIPESIACSIKWSVQRNPVFLILVPILWTTVILGIAFFIRFIRERCIIPAALGIAAVLFLAASSFWAFSAQLTLPGVVLLLVTMIPSVIAFGLAWRKGRG
ncbi:hypothetical protein AGMMS50267_17790 [Spirochaetia bacterium]|nr:hypothetical protein AGMMS50267_17790 [Spirochaetia bacterium]